MHSFQVSDYISKGGEKEDLSAHLCKLASENGSEDNITVIVVFLRNHIEVLQEAVENIEEVTTGVEDGEDKQATNCF